MGDLRFVTDTYLRDSDPTTYVNVESFTAELEHQIKARLDMPQTLEVVVHIDREEWMYYLVDHERQQLLWLEDYDITKAMASNDPTIQSESHLSLCSTCRHSSLAE